METELCTALTPRAAQCRRELLQRTGLQPDEAAEEFALLWQEDTLVATGARMGSILKCIAVDPACQGQDLTATVLTALRQSAFTAGHHHLFLYTKPQNRYLFETLFFYPVARTDKVLLMEDRRDGVNTFLSQFPKDAGPCGAAVMNCDPFTLGHRYLVETAAKQCQKLYVFVLSEDKGHYSAADRLEMVRRGTADLPNVTVLPTGPYLISSATFPTYFLKDRDSADTVHCQLDIEIFARFYAPHFGITHRFVGTEPLSPMTNLYNRALKVQLPQKGIAVTEIPRLILAGVPVSASAVRARLSDLNAIRPLVPQSTWEYILERRR